MDPLLNIGTGFTVIEPGYGKDNGMQCPLVECKHCGNEFYFTLEDHWVLDCPSCGIKWVNT